MTPAIVVETVTTPERFGELVHEWRALSAQCRPDDLFSRFEWFDAAWQWAQSRQQLRVLVARQGGECVGIAPFALARTRAGAMRLRTLEFLAVPDTPACALLVQQSCFDDVIRALAAALYQQGDWDRMLIERVPEDDVAFAALGRGLLACGYPSRIEPHSPNWIITMQGDWPHYWSTRSAKMRKVAQNADNRLRAAGTVETWRADTAMSAEALVNVVDDITSKSWKHGLEGAATQAGPHRFLLRLTEHAQRSGWLACWVLKLNGVPVAYEYALILNGTYHALRADYDQAYAKLSPGTSLFRAVMEDVHARHAKRYCLGSGDNPYKTRWSNGTLPLTTFTAFASTAAGRLAATWTNAIKPSLRRMRDKFSRSRATDDAA